MRLHDGEEGALEGVREFCDTSNFFFFFFLFLGSVLSRVEEVGVRFQFFFFFNGAENFNSLQICFPSRYM